MIEIKIPSENLALAAAIGAALVAYGRGESVLGSTTVTHTTIETVGEAAIVEQTKTLTTADVVKAVNEETAVKLNSAEEASELSPSDAGQTNDQGQSNVVELADAGGVGAAMGVSQPAGNDLANVDTKGVGKNADFCGNAAIPFNASGPTKGQWKKRQGVDKDAYAKWYAESLAAVGSGSGEQKPEIDTANAFNGDGDQAGQPEIDTARAFATQQPSKVNGQVVNNGQSQQKEIPGGLTFPDAGAYMKWQSEQQAAGNITNGDIESGYAQTQVCIQDLFNPATAANAVAQMYAFLAPIAGAQ